MAERIYYEVIPSEIPPSDVEWVRKVIRTGCEKGYFMRYNPRQGTKASSASKVVPNATMVRIGKLYGRRESTQWSKKETDAFKDIGVLSNEDIECVERYHGAMAKKPKSEDYRRRDLITLLSNWNAELDRSRNYRYSPRQDMAAGTDIKPPAGWRATFEKICGNKPFLEWHSLTPETQEEIIEYKG